MPTDLFEDITPEIMSLVRSLLRHQRESLTADTSLLTEAELDSLAMLELMEEIKKRYDVDLLMDGPSLEELRSVRSIVTAIHHRRKETAGSATA